MTQGHETPSFPVATFLQDERYGLRAPSLGDAEQVGVWCEGQFPIPPDTAGELLNEQETIPWGNNPTIRLMVVELATDAIVGGVLVERTDNRVSELKVTVGGPEISSERRQRISAAVLRLLVPWVMDELNLMTTRIDVLADQTIIIDAAAELGLIEAVRLREHIARPSGRVDLLMLERVNWQWGWAMHSAVKVGERVWLRPLQVADARPISLAGHAEAETEFQERGRVPTSEMAFASWIRSLASRTVPDAIVLAICPRDDDQCIGTVRLGQIDWINRTAETGTGLLAAGDRGRGIGTEAKHLLLEYAFVDLQLHVLHSMVFAGNTRSIAALEKQGYRLAGRLTADVQRGGTFHDTLVFDITRADWEQTRDRRCGQAGHAAR